MMRRRKAPVARRRLRAALKAFVAGAGAGFAAALLGPPLRHRRRGAQEK